ncbi:hypothetical protein BX616_001672 [Lobosporangium transversale]|uniref:F-box domain-containing protein n=1 Tax=Lobosporangium transversale TaxID=64571 RepID=A0A1Y2H2V8_9FUNG|nr:hypothetical protein BCR41DRAFT_391325 [Lobosporangium transversale]KAF9917192.1 hypothetical protein BX616_001672 [Lobosporangium transversale]ORZ28909.1 hypothetical protein BCR41DRAFT_391325 [Lobosporangium transversale]|eukprot:XP_021886582.1 hypothetical protein BCR41DRAFT_391325 [Lobosporangium transversale]
MTSRKHLQESWRHSSGFLNDDANKYAFTNISTLKLHKLKLNITNPPHSHTVSYCLGVLTRRCPELQSLKYYGCDEDDDGVDDIGGNKLPLYDRFYRTAFLQQPWVFKRLSSLFFPATYIKDEDMAAILRQMTMLKQLTISELLFIFSDPADDLDDFGQLSIRELLADKQMTLKNGHMVQETRFRRLCETIEEITFDVYGFKADGIMQTILSNCPCLKRLTGPRITVTEIVNGAEWVSTELTDLNIYLKADVDQETPEGMEKQRIVFRQLGKLTRLRSLDLVAQRCNTDGRTQTLDLTLRASLDEQANLKNLEKLAFKSDASQRMQLEDATWIVNNWPKLKELQGSMNNSVVCDSIVAVLRSRGSLSFRL